MATSSLRYLSAADVEAALPPVETRIELAERAMVALVEHADLPPKIGVHPRSPGSFGHAMPAWLRGASDDGSEDLLGMKWVVGFPDNVASGLPTIHGTILLSDARTGEPRGVLDAGVITAHRTAAVSGVAIRHWGPPSSPEPPTVALIGSGVQARSHLPVVSHLHPGAALAICGRDEGRLATLANDVADGRLGSFGTVRTTTSQHDAVEDADLVLTLISFGDTRQSIADDAFSGSATVVSIDYDMCVPASLANAASLFLTDDRGQFLANRTGSTFAGYPEPSAMMGEAILARTGRPEGRVLVAHLGVGLADVVFGDAILRAATAAGMGTPLET